MFFGNDSWEVLLAACCRMVSITGKRALYFQQKSSMSSAKEPYISRTNIHVLVIEWSEVQRSEGIDKRALYFPKKNPMSSAKEPLLQKALEPLLRVVE